MGTRSTFADSCPASPVSGAAADSKPIQPELLSLPSPRVPLILLAVIVVAGMGIRSYRLADRTIWLDEAVSWRTIQFPFSEMLIRAARDNHVPLHHVLLKLWTTAFGDSLWAMRGLSVLLGGVTMVAVYLFATEAFRTERGPGGSVSRDTGRWIGLFSAALVAVSLPQFIYAREARMYSLGTALVALSSWTFFRALHAPSRKRWTIHGIVTLLFAYTHHFALFSIGAQFGFLIGYVLTQRHRKIAEPSNDPLAGGAFLSLAIVAIGWGLWLPVFRQQAHQVQASWWAGPLSFWDVLSSFYGMFFVGMPTRESAGICAAACAAIVVALALAGRSGHWYVVSLTAVAFGLAVGASIALARNVFQLRYLLFIHLFLLVGAAGVVATIRDRLGRNAVALLLVAAGAVLLIRSWQPLDHRSDFGMKAAVGYIEARRQSDEHVVTAIPLLFFQGLYYSSDKSQFRLYSDGTPVPHHVGGALILGDDLIFGDQLKKVSAGRIWVIGDSARPPFPIPANWRLADQAKFPDPFIAGLVVNVSRYDMPADNRTPK
jgi:Dolichyl-phosphate-mannose-protein mannosyltransferase